jgi:Zn-dependent protease with chaperone function
MAGGLLLVLVVCVAVIHFETVQTRNAVRDMARDEISKGVGDGVEGGIGKAVDKETSVDNVVGKIRSTIDGLAADGTGGGGGAGASLPKAAGSAAKVAGDLLEQIGDNVRQSSDNGSARRPRSRKRSKTGSRDTSNRDTSGDRDTSGNSDASGDPAEPNGRDSSDAGSRGPNDLIGGLLNLSRGATKAGDQFGQRLFGLSADEESEWGQRLHEQIIDENEVVKNRALAKRIARIAAPLLSARQRREIDYTFTVIKSEDEDINAFSILGGYIYLHTALIDFVKNDQELQTVLAHEIGHVDLGHCTQHLTYSVRASQLASPAAGDMVGILHGIISRPYTKDQEFEADAYGFRAVIAAGQTRQQALAFPRRMGQYLKDHEMDEPADAKDEQTLAGRINRHFQTHPPLDERISRMEAIDVDSPDDK